MSGMLLGIIKRFVNSDARLPLNTLLNQSVSGTIMPKLNTIETKVDNVKIVKSIQRGIGGNIGSSNVRRTFTISISPVNPAKCVVILDNGGVIGAYRVTTGTINQWHYYLGAYVVELTATSLTIMPNCDNDNSSGTFVDSYQSTGWQVIEYY